MGQKQYGTPYSCSDNEYGFCEIYDLEKSLKGIWIRNQRNEDLIKYLREENKKIKDEKYKDTELSDMKEKLDKMQEDCRRGFPISEQEQAKINEFIKEHDEKHGSYAGAIGGRYKYEFIPTSIGVVGTIRCGVCGKEMTFCEMG